MVDLGGVGEVSERFEHFVFNMGFQWGTKGGAVAKRFVRSTQNQLHVTQHAISEFLTPPTFLSDFRGQTSNPSPNPNPMGREKGA